MASAQQLEIRAFLARVKKANGKLNPILVVAAAKREPKDSYAFRWFTWHDAEAAEAHRLEQARNMILFVRIVYNTTVREVQTVRYTANPVQHAKSDYIELSSIAPQTQHAKDVVLIELSRARGAVMRALDVATVLELHVLDDLVQAVDDAVEVVESWAPPKRGGRASVRRSRGKPPLGGGPSASSSRPSAPGPT